MQVDQVMNKYAQFAAQSSKQQDRFIPHRQENTDVSLNFEAKPYIFNSD